MSLSNELISQFAKITQANKTEKKETTVRGTTVEYNGSIYVKLDGSDRLTPISTTTDVKPNERVNVLIKDHSATVTGNISSPAARTDDVKDISNQISEFEIVIADKVSTKEFDAEKGRIDDLVTDNVKVKERLTATEADIDTLTAKDVEIDGKLTANDAAIENLETTTLKTDVADAKFATIENLEATDAKIFNLESTYGEFIDLTTDKLEAVDADIENLTTDIADINSASINYANIDFANITEAAIKKILSDTGLIGNLVLGNGTVTGDLCAVNINADNIKTGTMTADRLMLRDQNGLYYQLNLNALGQTYVSELTPEEQEALKSGIHGSNIIAKSITASTINVEDLIAFGATIAGFIIGKNEAGENAIYSSPKNSPTNTTNGLYLDKEGQFAFGDANNYLRFYKDSDGVYRLDFSIENSLNNTINQLDSSVKAKFEVVDGQFSTIATRLESLVVDENGQSLMTHEGDSLVFQMGKYINDINSANTKASDALKQSDDNAAELEETKTNIVPLLDLNAYIKVTRIEDPETGEVKPIIELGNDGAFKLQIVNTSIDFVKDQNRVAWIESDAISEDDPEKTVDSMVITRANIRDELQIGGTAWVERVNGNVGLVWKG